MSAILKREFKAFFQSVTGWLFLAVILCLFGLYFYIYNLLYGYPNVSYPLSSIVFILLITIPVLTMRVLSEERKLKTDQLILTSPVSVIKVVLGKYFAVAAVFTIAMLFISITPVLLGMFGAVPFAESYAAIFGFWLYGLTGIAIGVFVSSVTESQVIAAVLSFALLFIGYMMDGITSFISSSGNILTRILNAYNLSAGMDKFFGGMLDLKAVIYYVSMIALFLFFTERSLQRRRGGAGVFHIGFIAVALVCVIGINFIADKLPAAASSIDLTDKKIYTLTDETKEILKGLDEKITIYVLANEKEQDTTLKETLDRFKSVQPKIDIVYKDPDVSPTFYTGYSEDALTSNSLIVEGENRYKVIDYNDIYIYEVDYSTYQSTLTGYDGEGQITSAIYYVTDDAGQKIYQITGHNEMELSGAFLKSVEKLNIETGSLHLLEHEEIPEDACGLIINAPTTDFSEDDVRKILDYLDTGKKALIVTAYTTEEMKNFNQLLDHYNISMAPGLIIEGSSSNYVQNPFYLLPEIESSTVTEKAKEGYIFAPYAQGIQYPAEENETITYTPLLTTSESAYAKQDVESADSYEKGENDLDGPFTIGLLASVNDTKTQVYVIASEGLFTDSVSEQVYGNNANLFTSIISSFADEDASAVIAVKNYELSRLIVNQQVSVFGGIFGTIVVPALLLIIGIVIWIRRRKMG